MLRTNARISYTLPKGKQLNPHNAGLISAVNRVYRSIFGLHLQILNIKPSRYFIVELTSMVFKEETHERTVPYLYS